jgi:hypothetical protein
MKWQVMSLPEFHDFSFHVPLFVAVYLSNQAESDFDALRKVVDVA